MKNKHIAIGLIFGAIVFVTWAFLRESSPNTPVLPSNFFEISEKISEYQIFDLDPSPRIPLEKPKENGKLLEFHQYTVLKQKIIYAKDFPASNLLKIIDAQITRKEIPVAACFNPRHGIRMEFENKVYDLLICYECGGMYIYSDSAKTNFQIHGNGKAIDVLF